MASSASITCVLRVCDWLFLFALFLCYKTSLRMFVQRALSTSIFNMLGVNPGSLSFSCLVLKILSALTPKVSVGVVTHEQCRELLCRMFCGVRLSHRLSLSLLALGLKHFEGTEFPKPLISKYLVTCKTAHQLTVRIKNLNLNRAPNNVIKVSECENPVPPFLLSSQ